MVWEIENSPFIEKSLEFLKDNLKTYYMFFVIFKNMYKWTNVNKCMFKNEKFPFIHKI